MRIGDHEAGPDSPTTYRAYTVFVKTRLTHGVWLASFTVWRSHASNQLTAVGNGIELGVFASDRVARAYALEAATRYIDSFFESVDGSGQ